MHSKLPAGSFGAMNLPWILDLRRRKSVFVASVPSDWSFTLPPLGQLAAHHFGDGAFDRTITIYRLDAEPDMINIRQELSGEPHLPGFSAAAEIFA